MIIPLLVLAATGPTILGIVNPDLPDVGFAAVARLPELSGRDQQLVHVLARVLPQGTLQYTLREALNVTDGRSIRCDVLPDCILIRFGVSQNELRSGASLMTSLVREGTFRQDHIDAAVNSLGRRELDSWSRGVTPFRFGVVKATQAEIVRLYQTIFRPSSVTITCVARSVDQLADLWNGRFLGWRGLEPFKYPSQKAPLGPLPRPSDLQFLDFRGKPTRELAPALLALYAFGAGKQSALHRLVREKLGWSYRQEAMLWPASSGVGQAWTPRLLAAISSPEGVQSRLEVLRQELLADVASWNEDTRHRALGMANANLSLGLPIGPIYLGPRPFAGYADDYAAFTAIMQAKIGQPLTPDKVLDLLNKVNLDQLKTTAMRILQP